MRQKLRDILAVITFKISEAIL